MTSTGSQRSVRPDKVTLIAVWFSINAAISLFLFAPLCFFFLPARISGELVSAAALVVGFLSVVFGVLDVAAVVGLLRLREWGRWLGIVLAVLGLFFIPVHTIVGALIIRYLLSDEAKHAFGVAALPEPTPTGTEGTPH